MEVLRTERKFLSTLDLLQDFFLRDVDPLEGLADLLLPEGNELVMRQDVGGRSQI